MAKYDLAEFAAINARAYRDYLASRDLLANHPNMKKIGLTREQLEAICRDLEAYAACAAELDALRGLMREWENQGSTRDIAYRDDLCERWLAALAEHETGNAP